MSKLNTFPCLLVVANGCILAEKEGEMSFPGTYPG